MFIYDNFKLLIIGILFIAMGISAAKSIIKGETSKLIGKIFAFAVAAFLLYNPIIIFHLMNLLVKIITDVTQNGDILKSPEGGGGQPFPQSTGFNQ